MHEIRLPADHECAKDLRAVFASFLRDEGVDSSGCDDALLVATELFSNAVNASAPDNTILCLVRIINVRSLSPFNRRGKTRTNLLYSSSTRLVIEVKNVGKKFSIGLAAPPSLIRFGGRGIAIARALGTVSVHHGDGVTTVSVTLNTRLPRVIGFRERLCR
jgi:Histidine kinase-like ATPase domain